MHTHCDPSQKNKSQSVTSSVSQKQSGDEATFQFTDNRPETIVQRKLQKMTNNYTAQKQSIQKKNNTGLPDNLKSGTQLNAHAYAQGTNIHLASGQEKHLPHEAWHVVQQKQGRVQPTIQMKGPSTSLRNPISINDDLGLEKEADVMGARAMGLFEEVHTITENKVKHPITGNEPYQLKWEQKKDALGAAILVGFKINEETIFLLDEDQQLAYALDREGKPFQFKAPEGNVIWESAAEIDLDSYSMALAEALSEIEDTPELATIKDVPKLLKFGDTSQLSPEADLDAYDEARKKLFSERKILYVLETKEATDAVQKITDLPPKRGLKTPELISKAIVDFNNAIYFSNLAVTASSGGESEITKEETSSPEQLKIKSLHNPVLETKILSDGLLDDPVVTGKMKYFEGQKFAWTNLKGIVGEFYGIKEAENRAEKESKKTGGVRKLVNVVVTDPGSADSDPKRHREIDGIDMEISSKQWVVKAIYEIKATTSGKSNQKGTLNTELQKKLKSLQTLDTKNNRVWTMTGEALDEDITNKLAVPDVVPLYAMGPKNDTGGRYDIHFDVDVNAMVDQLLIIWLRQNDTLTLKDVSLGTGASDSKFSKEEK